MVFRVGYLSPRLVDLLQRGALRPLGRPGNHASSHGRIGNGDRSIDVTEPCQDAAQRLELRTALRDPAGKEIAEATMLVDLPAQSMRKFVQRLNVARPLRWSAASTNLYTAHSSLRVPEGEPKDELDTTFGIRHVQWDSQRGLLVNGESVLLKGACIHHDLGCLGAAFNKQAMARRLATLKNIGFNAIRCSHNPPAPELLDLCDRMGFYVIDEAFDKWGGSNYATFEQDWKMDLLMMLKRDRNHPSILLWSVGNEVRQQGSAEGPEMLRRMTTLVHRVRPVASSHLRYVPSLLA